jgi:hypothetical protein
MQSELKEGESRKGVDEFGNEFTETREGRITVRKYLGQKIIGKTIGEIRRIGRAPDRIGVDVAKSGKGYVATVKVISSDVVESEKFSIKEGFENDIKGREKLEEKILKRFEDLLVRAEAGAIVFNIVDKIRVLEAEEERLKKKSELAGKEQKEDITNYVIVSGLYGNSYKIPWEEFLKVKEGSGDKGKG